MTIELNNKKYTTEYRPIKMGDKVIKDRTVYQASIADADDLGEVVIDIEDLSDNDDSEADRHIDYLNSRY